jgi:hypothetical protein
MKGKAEQLKARPVGRLFWWIFPKRPCKKVEARRRTRFEIARCAISKRFGNSAPEYRIGVPTST